MAIPYEKEYLYRIEPEDKIYKFIPLKYVKTMLEKGTIRISNVMEWEDIYENFFLKQNFFLNGKPVDVREVANNNFGMSWTLNQETDAMWRIYSKCGRDFCNMDNVAIRVETTASKLLNTFWGKVYDSPAFVEEIDYVPQELIDITMKNGRCTDISSETMASLRTKRKEFEHEKEVRLIISVGTDKLQERIPYVDIQFSPLELFESFMIDPRATEEQEREIREVLTLRGVPEELVSKSRLYYFEPHDINIM